MNCCFVQDGQPGVAVGETEERLREAKVIVLTGPTDSSRAPSSGTTLERPQSGREGEDRSGQQA